MDFLKYLLSLFFDHKALYFQFRFPVGPRKLCNCELFDICSVDSLFYRCKMAVIHKICTKGLGVEDPSLRFQYDIGRFRINHLFTNSVGKDVCGRLAPQYHSSLSEELECLSRFVVQATYLEVFVSTGLQQIFDYMV